MIFLKGDYAMKSKVYFSREITPVKISEMYDLVSANLEGKTAIKLHSGEVGNQNFIGPDFWADVIKKERRSRHRMQYRIRRLTQHHRKAP